MSGVVNASVMIIAHTLEFKTHLPCGCGYTFRLVIIELTSTIISLAFPAGSPPDFHFLFPWFFPDFPLILPDISPMCFVFITNKCTTNYHVSGDNCFSKYIKDRWVYDIPFWAVYQAIIRYLCSLWMTTLKYAFDHIHFNLKKIQFGILWDNFRQNTIYTKRNLYSVAK